MLTGTIFNIEEFTFHDGDGVRVTIFMKGCPLDCKWCHNPEGKNYNPELLYHENKCCHCGLCKNDCSHDDCKSFFRCIHVCPNNALTVCGERFSSEELATKILKYKDFFSRTSGGVTFSGGEPMAQWPFIKEVISKLEGINIAIETSGYCSKEAFVEMINTVNYVFMDIKLINENQHIKYTGRSNKIILKNFELLKNSRTPFTIRTPLIKGICDTEENLTQIKQFIKDSKWELLPENGLARTKDKWLLKDEDSNN